MNTRNNNVYLPRVTPFTVEGVELFSRNFAGVARPPYTPAGVRNFCMTLPGELAAQLAEDGWNIFYLKPREEGDEPQPAIRVAVAFDYYNPPAIYKIIGNRNNKMVQLTPDNVSTLDSAEIVRDDDGKPRVDVVIRGRRWGDDGKKIKAYLEKMYITVYEDELDLKYAAFRDEELPFNT